MASRGRKRSNKVTNTCSEMHQEDTAPTTRRRAAGGSVDISRSQSGRPQLIADSQELSNTNKPKRRATVSDLLVTLNSQQSDGIARDARINRVENEIYDIIPRSTDWTRRLTVYMTRWMPS